MRVVLRPKVDSRLPEIYLYNLENGSEKRAVKVISSLYQAFYDIGRNPLQYPKHPKYQHLAADTRKAIVHRTYIITFRIFQNHVAILDVYHGKRKPI